MVNPLDMLMRFIFDNIFVIVICGLAIYFAMMYLKVKSKSKYKVIDRRKIEKANFIEEMKYNIATKYKYLYKGTQLIGKITHYATGIVDVKGKSPVNVVRMVFKPTFKNIPFVKPFAKPEALMLEDDSLTPKKIKEIDEKINEFNIKIGNAITEESKAKLRLSRIEYITSVTPSIKKDAEKKKISISNERSINYYFGIYFDEKDVENIHSPNIINTRVLKTDVEQLASRYFTKSQEQCVYSPEMAHQFALKERELAIELAKAKGKRESI